MDLNELINQFQRAASLYAEILVLIAAAGVFGWLVGLMMQRARHNRQTEKLKRSANKRYNKLKQTTSKDAEQLEEQLQALASESKSLQSSNRSLKDTMRNYDASMQKSRAESIELNRRHTETQERLQRIIQQKDRELAEMANPQRPLSQTLKFVDPSPGAALHDGLDSDVYSEDTVAIFPSNTPREHSHEDPVVATIQPGHSSGYPDTDSLNDTSRITNRLDSSLDDTADLSNMGDEESTVALTDETLALVHNSFKKRTEDS